MNALKDFIHMLFTQHREQIDLIDQYKDIRVFLGANTPNFYERFIGALM
jgi:hypothetical protein